MFCILLISEMTLRGRSDAVNGEKFAGGMIDVFSRQAVDRAARKGCSLFLKEASACVAIAGDTLLSLRIVSYLYDDGEAFLNFQWLDGAGRSVELGGGKLMGEDDVRRVFAVEGTIYILAFHHLVFTILVAWESRSDELQVPRQRPSSSSAQHTWRVAAWFGVVWT